MKKVLSLFLVMLMVFSFSSVAMADDSVQITIVHTNDTHARIESGDSSVGFAKISTITKELRAENPNVLLIDAGDTFHGQTIATLSEGESITQVMNVMGYDLMVPGNHDFNYGKDRLLELADMLDFPMLSANITYEDGTPFLDSYTIKEVDGVKIGIFGLTSPETTYKTHPDNVKGLVFEDPAVVAQQMVDLLKDQTDVIICVGHIGEDSGTDVTSKDILNAVDGIDIFIDGHSHTTKPEGEMVNGALLVQTGGYDSNVGVVDFTVTGGEVTAKSARLISPADAADVEEDPDVMSAIEAVKAENDLITSVVVGNTDVLLEGTRELVRTGETNLGNLITNAMLYETGAQIAITNGGGIRASIEPGEITVGDVITVLPFGNYIVTLDVTGADIIAALENGLTDYPDPKGAFPHVAGLTFTFDPTQPAYSRVVDVLVDGEPLDPAAVYSVATNDFMAAGGDEYTTLGASKQTGEFAALDEALISYIGVVDPATVQVEGRVSVAAEEEVTEEPTETVTETPAVSETYTVVSGDVLWKIAQKYGFTWQVIAEFNHMENPNLIYPGDEIQIPAQ